MVKRKKGSKPLMYFKAKKIGLGTTLLVIGLLWFAKDMGWLEIKVSMWPIMLILLGIWALATGILQY